MAPLSSSFQEPRPALRAFDHVGGIVAKSGIMGLPKEELKRLVMNSDCSEEERELSLKMLDQVDVDGNNCITEREWFEFVDKIADEIMQHGHINGRCHKFIGFLDMFAVETWHKFRKYQQISWVGALFGLILRVAFLMAVIFAIMVFWKDSKTTMLQEFVMNDYNMEDVSPFFFYFRTSSWDQVNDPTLFSFEMSTYVKRLDVASGNVIEEWFPVESRLVTKADVDWWPASVDASITAVMPLQTVRFAGAYHLDYFEQLEVRLVPCRNGTSSSVCQPDDVINDALHGGSVNFVTKLNELGFASARTQYWTVMLAQTKQIDLWFDRKIFKITGKYPWISNDEVTQHMLFTSATQQIAPPWGDGTLAVWWFSQSPNAQRETLVRETLIDLIAQCGGTWATLVSVFGLAAYWYNRRKLDKSIESLRTRARFVEDLRILCSRTVKLSGSLPASPEQPSPQAAAEVEGPTTAVETV